VKAVASPSRRSVGPVARTRGRRKILARSVKPAVTADTCARLAALPRPRAPESGDRRPRVLLTDAQDRSSLAACRSLHRAGYAVDAVASNRPAAAHWSRFCDRRLAASDPRVDEARFVEELIDIARTASYRLLVTGSDASLLAVSRHRERFEEFIQLGLPPAEVVERCVSKQALADAALKSGLGAPDTKVCANETEAIAAARRFGYPAVLKPPSTVLARNGGAVQRGSAVLRDEASLEALWPEYGAQSLIQQRLDGDVVSFSGVAADSRLLAYGMSRYRRTWPPEGGAVSFAETISTPTGLRRNVERLIRTLEWEGVFELELVQQGTRFAAIDFNPRLFGSLELITRAGAPLSAAWCDWVLGFEPIESEARAGYRYRWEDAEARNLWRRLQERRLRSALSMLRPHRHMTRSFFRPTDPAPLVARLLLLLTHLFRGSRSTLAPTALEGPPKEALNAR
jgi:predicted ATP-grasp superfamily ATP-dependent carboligase